MTGKFFPDEIFYTQIEKDLKNNSQVQEGKKPAVNLCSYGVLYLTVDTKNIDGLNDKI